MSKINQKTADDEAKADQDIHPGSSDDVQDSDEDEFSFINQHLAGRIKPPTAECLLERAQSVE